MGETSFIDAQDSGDQKIHASSMLLMQNYMGGNQNRKHFSAVHLGLHSYLNSQPSFFPPPLPPNHPPISYSPSHFCFYFPFDWFNEAHHKVLGDHFSQTFIVSRFPREATMYKQRYG